MLSIHIGCYLPIVQIKDYNAMNNGRKFFDQLIKRDFKNDKNIWKN